MSTDGRYTENAGALSDISTDGRTDICSSVIAPALPYYRPSVDICNICTTTIRGGGIRAIHRYTDVTY